MNTEKADQEKARINKIKAKVMTIARFNLLLKKEKENSDLIAKAKKMYPDGKLPVGAIFDGLETTKNELVEFLKNKEKDKKNEKNPIAIKMPRKWVIFNIILIS